MANRYEDLDQRRLALQQGGGAERIARQQQLNSSPPNPGSILVTNDSETWETLSARLEAHEAGDDGLALKKMIAAGAGLPLHFLAEPESATRTTAEAAGGPTFRHFEQRQQFFLWLLRDILKLVIARRAQVDSRIRTDVPIEIHAGDISSRDNLSLSVSAANILPAASMLRDRGLIDDAELLRLVYHFCGESIDLQAMLERGRAAPPAAQSSGTLPSPVKTPLDPLTGEMLSGVEAGR